MASESWIELEGLPRLRVRTCFLGGERSYFGTREQLLAAGVIDETTPMPGDPGISRSCKLFEADHPLRLRRAKRLPGDRFTLDTRLPQEEVACHAALVTGFDAWREQRIQEPSSGPSHLRLVWSAP